MVETDMPSKLTEARLNVAARRDQQKNQAVGAPRPQIALRRVPQGAPKTARQPRVLARPAALGLGHRRAHRRYPHRTRSRRTNPSHRLPRLADRSRLTPGYPTAGPRLISRSAGRHPSMNSRVHRQAVALSLRDPPRATVGITLAEGLTGRLPPVRTGPPEPSHLDERPPDSNAVDLSEAGWRCVGWCCPVKNCRCRPPRWRPDSGNGTP